MDIVLGRVYIESGLRCIIGQFWIARFLEIRMWCHGKGTEGSTFCDRSAAAGSDYLKE